MMELRKTLVLSCAIVTIAGAAMAQSPSGPSMEQPKAPSAQTQTQKSAPAAQSPAAQSPAAQPKTGTGNLSQMGTTSPKSSDKVTFYSVQPSDLRVSELMGVNVTNLQNETVGEIEDILVDKNHSIRAFVVSVGGFLGIGDRNVALEPNAFQMNEQSNGSIKVTLNTTKEELKNAPAVTEAELNRAGATTGSAKR
jgi:sporulation protein YlmC with PRC-barrel domain